MGKKKQVDWEKVGEKAYDGLSDFGRGYALLTAIVATIIGLVLIGVGAYYLSQPDKFTNSNSGGNGGSGGGVTATITDEGTKVISGGKYYYTDATISYTVDGVTYTPKSSFVLDDSSTTFTVYYNKDHPAQNTTEDHISSRTVGGIMLGIGIFLIIFAWIMYYLSSKYKFIAALMGARGAKEIVFG